MPSRAGVGSRRIRWGDTTLHPLLVAAAGDLVDGEIDQAEIGRELLAGAAVRTCP